MTLDYSPAALASRYADIGRRLSSHARTDGAFRSLTDIAVREVPGAQFAGITRGRPGRFTTVAPTAEIVHVVDKIQYNLGSGPCVDAIVKDTVFRADDLRSDPRWPRFGSKAFETAGIVSMLSFRLFVEENGLVAGLNMYSTEAAAFDTDAETIGLILATHGALAITAAVAREQVNNLERALSTSREIGIAMGILMSKEKITREQAFDLLRVASQHSHRKLADIAVDVALTGDLQLPSGPAE